MTNAIDLLPEGWQHWPEHDKRRILRTLQSVAAPDWYHSGARQAQIAPPTLWDLWLVVAGRGFGKTRTGAEWSWRKAEQMPRSRGALVAPTAADVRDVMIEGESGILATCPPHLNPKYEPSKRRVTYENGSMQFAYSADEPDRLRGPQHHYAWVDEWAAMRKGDELMTMLEMGLRLGQHPQRLITTTPRPLKWLRAAMKEQGAVVTRGSSYDNLQNLAPSFRRAILDRYEGTRLGRQELHAEILDDIEGAIWSWAMVGAARETGTPEQQYSRIVVGVDPAVTSGEDSDETGIVAVGLVAGSEPPQFAVLADRSGRFSPDEWARIAADTAAQFDADAIVAEVNNGGDLVGSVLRQAAPWSVRVQQVRATKGKIVRAEPIVALYEQGRVGHAAGLDLLEDQMTAWVPGEGQSPDRVDALVWAMTSLATARALQPVRSFAT